MDCYPAITKNKAGVYILIWKDCLAILVIGKRKGRTLPTACYRWVSITHLPLIVNRPLIVYANS